MRPVLGAAALGGLEPAEEIALRAHLDGCAECRAELRELTSVARALPFADPSRVASRTEPPAALEEAVRGRLEHERSVRRAHRRRRAAIGAAASLAAVAAALILFLAWPAPSPGGTHVVFPTTGAVTARAVLRAKPAGTQVEFHESGLASGRYYWLWLTGEDGERVAAGTFRGTRNVDVVMTAALALRDTRRIWVTDAHDQVVLDHWLTRPG